MHLQDAIQGFLLQLQADGRSAHTIGQYRRHGNALANWMASADIDANVAALTPETIARFFASDAARTSCRGGAKKATSANAMRTSIRCLAKHLHDAGLVATNTARLLRRARCAPPPPKALRDDEQARLLSVLAAATGPEAERDRMLVELLLGTGIRIGSAVAIDIEDLDLAHGELTLRKAKNDRPATVVVPRAVVDRLRSYIRDRKTGPVFQAGDHRVSIRNVQRRIAGWFQAAGITGRSAHSLRHSFATGLLAKTGDLRLVQAALNHASVVSTTIYAQVDRSRLRAAVGQ
jgi:integrase/recombinase XerC